MELKLILGEDGVLYVGNVTKNIKRAKNKVAETYNYLPPSIRKKKIMPSTSSILALKLM